MQHFFCETVAIIAILEAFSFYNKFLTSVYNTFRLSSLLSFICCSSLRFTLAECSILSSRTGFYGKLVPTTLFLISRLICIAMYLWATVPFCIFLLFLLLMYLQTFCSGALSKATNKCFAFFFFIKKLKVKNIEFGNSNNSNNKINAKIS